ncbi:MAG: phage tail protein [Serratia fonticola]
MSQTAITKAFEAWLVDKTVNGEPARPDKMIFAFISGQDENAEIDRNEGMPSEGQIRHTADITQFGALNENAVVYSVVLDTTVGNWNYNWVGLVDSATGTVLMIVHLAEQQKIKTENGQQGNSLIRNLAMEFDGAAAASQINVTPETWMIDFSARLQSMDESRRLANVDYYGDAAFRADGFKVTVADATATITAGLGYVGGLRAIMTHNQALALAGKTGVWVDICWQGTVTGAWANSVTLRAADALVDYVDNAGYRHFVTRIAHVNGTNVTDERKPFPLDDLRQDVEDLDVYSKGEADARFLLKIGDTATGKLGAPYFQANGNSGNGWPEGAGAYLDQLNTRAPFFQPNFDWEGQAGIATYVPLTKGRATRKGKGWPTAVSFGYLLPKEDKSAQPVIHVISDAAESTWVFDTDNGRIYSKAGTFALQSETTPVGVPMPWPGNVAPLGHALFVGQAFDKVANPQLAVVYPSGVLPDMRGRTILGNPVGRAPLSLADGEVKYHGHTGEVGGTDLGSKETTANGYFKPKVRAYRSNTALDGGDSERFSFTAHNEFADHGLVEDTPAHTHWVTLGWHGHSLRIDAFGAAKNTVDNIAFNYIVRLG